MSSVYLLFKLLHIVGAIVWLGGLVTVSVLGARVASSSDASLMRAMNLQSQFFGRAVVGPAAAVTLVAGFVMVGTAGIGGPLWVIWGFAAIVLSLLLGATVIRRTGNRLSERLAAAVPGDLQLRALQRQMGVWSNLNLLILFSAAFAMVFKPTL